uniref:Centriolar and ciliogenesis-associated protein HYLS1 C-terminal domain-containing protein n=1 Tax=Romanomermis culicivorax TaxID=13658 RepID=A0A915KUK6_ROMCU
MGRSHLWAIPKTKFKGLYGQKTTTRFMQIYYVENERKMNVTLRYKKTAQPGIPPFRNDPVKRYEIYREQWAKFPVPGEDKRLGLRWKVRDFMSRQDIPDLPKSA